MKVAIIGVGAMDSIYGGHLPLHSEVYLVDTNQSVVDQINESGLRLSEDGRDVMYRPATVASTEGLREMDLVTLFVKALLSKAVLGANRGTIGPDIYVLTLQNGSGHGDVLSESIGQKHIIIGTTEDNGVALEADYAQHGGGGKMNVGMLTEDKNGMLPAVGASFNRYDLQMRIHENIQELIRGKLMINVSLSAVTDVLQVEMDYIVASSYAWNLTSQLVKETVTVAGGFGFTFDGEEALEKARTTSRSNPEGITSIYADIVTSRKTEVDTISGSVIRATQKSGASTPTRETIVNIVHVLEGEGTKTL